MKYQYIFLHNIYRPYDCNYLHFLLGISIYTPQEEVSYLLDKDTDKDLD